MSRQKQQQTDEQIEFYKKIEKLRITDFNESLCNNDDSLCMTNGTKTLVSPPSIGDFNVPKFDLDLFHDALMLNADCW